MKLELYAETRTGNSAAAGTDLPYEELARTVLGEVLRAEGCPFDAQASLVVTDGPGIRALNRDFRGIDSETDVLSFPGAVISPPSDFDSLAPGDPDAFDPDTGELMLGDIVINEQRVIAQAEEYGHSQRREFAFLVAHSALHLLGYDHETPEEAQEMERRQEEVLTQLGITRDRE